jgi:hypothetical protein
MTNIPTCTIETQGLYTLQSQVLLQLGRAAEWFGQCMTQAELFATREKNGIYIPADQYQQKEVSSAASQARAEALEQELEAAREAHQLALDGLTADLQATQKVNPGQNTGAGWLGGGAPRWSAISLMTYVLL